MIKKLLFPLFFFLFSLQTILATDGYFEFTPLATEAYQKTLELKIEEASVLLARAKNEEPNNMMVYFVENYLDFMRVFINENEKEFKQLLKNKDRRLERIKSGDTNSPYYLYTQAEIKLQWALLHLKFDEYLSALSNIKSAYKLLSRNLDKHPDFLQSKKSLGLLHALVGTVPDSYKWAVKLLSGMDGTIEQGTKEIEEVLAHARRNNDVIFEQETLVLYSFLMLHLKNESDAAWKLIHSGNLDPNESPLACFAVANMAMRIGQNDEAIRILENRPSGKAYYPLHFLDFMLGLAKLRRLDEDADIYLNKYIHNFRGQNYIKEAYQKLAWHSLLKGDEDKYKKYMNQVKARGNTSVSNDKSALTEAKKGIVPDPILLQARILFDGGYYQKAYSLLKGISQYHFSDKGLQLEYIYRLGRIAHEMKNTTDGLYYYDQTIKVGRNQRYYFACNAAFKAGLICEEMGNKTKAKEYYNICLSLKPDEYKNSLHGLAKAGLNRLKD